MRNEVGPTEVFWINNVNSPFAELIMASSDKNWKSVAMIPIVSLFILVSVLLIPVFKIERRIVNRKK